MDKYQSAIAEYEKCRLWIKDLSHSIDMAANHPPDEEGPGGSKCSNQINGDACIKRYWEANKVAYWAGECGEDVKPEQVKLCKSCKEVDRLVIQRKQARKQFGIAKRRISQIGKGLMKGDL